MSQRVAFLNYFTAAIGAYQYALLKFLPPSMDALPEHSDLDILIDEKDKANFLHVIRTGPDIERIHLQRKSFATFVSMLFKDGSYLEIDLIHRFDRKGIIYLNAEEVLNHAITDTAGLLHASAPHNFEYIMLFYQLNHAKVPQKYRAYFAGFTFEQRTAIFAHITGKYKVNINVLDELYEPHTRFSKKIIAHVNSLRINQLILRIAHTFRYYVDVAGDMLNHRGITVTFSGVDGAGKSTIIEEVKTELQNKYRQKTVVLRHRPSLFPILSSFLHGKTKAERMTRENNPRQGKNTSVISSFFRFLYYYIDFVIGQYYIYLRYTLRGYTVIYDRYYFDFIIDARRSNIVLSQGFMKWCYHFIFKPKVNVFLFAPAEVIKSRKNELSDQDIHELTNGYKKLFDELGKGSPHQHYLVINNINFDDTFRLVMKECVSATI